VFVGTIWVNGTVILGFALPLLAIGVLGELGILDRLSGEAGLVLVFSLLLGMFPMGWLGWSFQVSRWRRWAYQRVEDIAALKSAAVAAGIIWPDGHKFESTEFRSEELKRELERLEAASAKRASESKSAREIKPPATLLGTAGAAFVFAAGTMPLMVLAPIGLLSFVGVDVPGQVTWWVAGAYTLALWVVIFLKARFNDVGADQAFASFFPAPRKPD
jgi:hypothetical protein